jgi:hypothetical protein
LRRSCSALVLWLNAAVYGSPLRTGYGQPADLFSPSHIPANVRYFRWLVETHTPFPLLGLLAPFLIGRERRGDVLLAIALIFITVAIYLAYTPFDDWSYLRFLLPAIALMIVLASAVSATALDRAAHAVPGFSRTVAALLAATTLGLAVFCVRAATDRQAFALQSLEQRYRSAGVVVREQFPSRAVVLSVWDSGAVRFQHGRGNAPWEALDPAWLERTIAWLEQHGYPPYLLFESWEEEAFRRRFAASSDIGKLDWPPRYEVDRKVRVYDPRDRERYQRGVRVDTEFLWPLKD